MIQFRRDNVFGVCDVFEVGEAFGLCAIVKIVAGSLPRAHRSQPGDGRGMVSVEFAIGILASIIVMIMLGWGIFLFGVKIAAIDAAGAVARQSARGDAAAVRAAQQAGPAHASYRVISNGTRVRVLVTVDARPIDSMPTYRVSADAEASLEPGEGGGER